MKLRVGIGIFLAFGLLATFDSGVRAHASIAGSWEGSPQAPGGTTGSFEQSSSSDAADVIGNWMGVLSFSGVELHLIVKVAIDSTGALISKLDSPDQGATDIPTDVTTFLAGHLSVDARMIGGNLEGDLSADKTAIMAKWTQGGVSLPLQLTKVETPPVLNRPQEPKPPFPYEAREVAYRNPSTGDTLAGTLTFPRSGGPFGAVLLITGSGPQNRDEELMGHKPFLVLADDLTRRGLAVLRVDDRGVGQSTGRMNGATSLDFVSDVLAGVGFLKTQKEIDSGKIGLLGHSEGGLIAPMAAAQSSAVAFIVLLAGPGVRGDELLLEQQARIFKTLGMDDESIAKNRTIQRQLMAVVTSPIDSAAADAKLRQIIAGETAEMSDSLKTILEYEGDGLDLSIRQLLSPWLRYFLAHDPGPVLERVKCPVLAIDGDKDLQVCSSQNLPAIAAALERGGNNNVTVKELRGLNHLFQTAGTGSPNEYGKIEETISPAVLALVGEWMLDHLGGS